MGSSSNDVLRVVHERASRATFDALAMEKPAVRRSAIARMSSRSSSSSVRFASRSLSIPAMRRSSRDVHGRSDGIEAEAIRQNAELACAACGVATASTSSTRASPLSGFITA